MLCIAKQLITFSVGPSSVSGDYNMYPLSGWSVFFHKFKLMGRVSESIMVMNFASYLVESLVGAECSFFNGKHLRYTSLFSVSLSAQHFFFIKYKIIMRYLMDIFCQFESFCWNSFIDKTLPLHLLWHKEYSDLKHVVQGLQVVNKQSVLLTLKCWCALFAFPDFLNFIFFDDDIQFPISMCVYLSYPN